MFKRTKFFCISLYLLSFAACAGSAAKEGHHDFYLGPVLGYGSTTWEGLVPTASNANPVLMLSTPVKAKEGGFIWGIFGGVELSQYFAVEAAYTKFPNTTVHFDESSLFSFERDGRTSFKSETDAMNLMAKIFLIVPETSLRVYSSFGISGVHRNDEILKTWALSPSFSAGLNYKLTSAIMAELGGNYTAGYGESQLSPSDSYIPFLYSFFFRVGYFF